MKSSASGCLHHDLGSSPAHSSGSLHRSAETFWAGVGGGEGNTKPSYHESSPDHWLSLYSGSTSQAVVTQETSLTTTPGGTVTLTCGSSTGAVTTSNYAGWIQQKSSQVPQGIIGSTGTRLPGVPARFTGSLLGDKAALTITGAQAEDEATYYCILWFSNHVHSGICRWRSETKTPGLSLTLCP